MTEGMENAPDSVTSQIAELLRGGDADRAADENEPSGEQVAAVEDELAAALGGLEDESPEPDGEAETPEETPLVSLADAAEKLGLSKADLYKLQVPMPGDGEPMTLGELKDKALEWDKSVSERETHAETMRQQRLQMVQVQNEVRELVSMIPPELMTQQMLDQARSRIDAAKSQAVQDTLQLVPEWKDREAYAADRELMNAHIAKYGFDPEDLDVVLEPRLFAYVRAQAKREQQIEQALEKVRAQRQRQGSPKTTGKPKGEPRRQVQGLSGRAATISAVADVIRGK